MLGPHNIMGPTKCVFDGCLCFASFLTIAGRLDVWVMGTSECGVVEWKGNKEVGCP